MNVLQRKFNGALETLDSYRCDIYLRRAIGEFSLALRRAEQEADKESLRKSAIYQEARATNAYLHSDPYTAIGIGQLKIAERSMARARKCKNWNEDLFLQHKNICATYDRVRGFDDASQSGMLPSDIKALGEIAP